MDVEFLTRMVGDLILDNDTLGLPGLGSFVVEQMPASFSDKGYTINPPYRRLTLVSKESQDGLLAALYARDNSITIEEAESMLQMTIGETLVDVEWEDNGSVEALKELCQEGPLTIRMSMYGGFEQVGSIGQSLPRDDTQTTTQAGDIVLYSGDQIVVFYGSNSWAYTRLGHITDKTAQEMAELLGNGDVTITIEME